MEEDKIQKLHDSLSKLRRGKGLGISSHYNFGGGNSVDNGHGVNIKENGNGELYREDGLPVNALYSNFLKQGSYSKTDSALKYGDGRKIKRNFDDCTSGGEEGSDGDSTKAAKKRKKAEKKALKKAEKLEAKKKAKIEEKKRAKLEAKKKEKLEAKKKAKIEEKESKPQNSTSPEVKQSTDESNTKIKKEKKMKKKSKDETGTEINKNKKEKKKQKKKSKSS